MVSAATFADVDGDGRPELVCHWLDRWGLLKFDAKAPTKPWHFEPVSQRETIDQFYHGTGIGDVSWREIEIRCNNDRGRPTLLLHGAAALVAAELAITQWDISLTHTAEYASAVAVGM